MISFAQARAHITWKRNRNGSGVPFGGYVFFSKEARTFEIIERHTLVAEARGRHAAIRSEGA